ncbi:MAG TPA: hypothetical protein VGF59_14415 [Bryobacteraceae bacterium]
MRLDLAMAASAWLAFAAPGLPQRPAPFVIHVLDQTRAPSGLLRHAMEQARNFFDAGGIPTEWVLQQPDDQNHVSRPIGDGDAILRILSHSSDHSRAFGTAILLHAGGVGVYATIYLDRVMDSARDSPATVWLGFVMAHEVGHLLGLPHSIRGPMRPSLHPSDIPRAATGALKFDPEQLLRLRESMASRGATIKLAQAAQIAGEEAATAVIE